MKGEVFLRWEVFTPLQTMFMPCWGITYAIFIHRQLQEKHLARNRKLYLAFVDLEKAFNQVPRKVIWWAM